MKHLFLIFAFIFPSMIMAQESSELVLPTQKQVEWSDAEIGMMLHFDLQCFPGYDKQNLNPANFNPDQLNTDQWVRTAKELGAKYIVMIAKHGTGFCLWPTDVYECSVKQSPWKNGKGDVIADFIKSCKKYGIKPGFYYCTHCNDFCGIDHHKVVGSITQDQYNDIVVRQLTELWGNYGELFEVWFDGGIKSVDEGGIDLRPLLEKLQPGAIAFQGPAGYSNLIRWVGNEDGMAPDPCWSTDIVTTNSDGSKRIDGLKGSTSGKIWCPGESDCTLRKSNGWMFEYLHPERNEMFSVEELMSKYETSVGRNTNMLIGLVIDNHGLIPEADAKRAAEFGAEIRRTYGTPLCSLTGVNGSVQTLKFKKAMVDRCIIQEDIQQGERIRTYRIEGQNESGDWILLKEGENAGHKRIVRFEPQLFTALRLTVTSSIDTPIIKTFSVFQKL